MRVDLDALEALEKAATPGPWAVDYEEDVGGVMGIDAPNNTQIVKTDTGFYPPRKNDADLIVALRNNAAAMITRLRELECER